VVLPLDVSQIITEHRKKIGVRVADGSIEIEFDYSLGSMERSYQAAHFCCFGGVCRRCGSESEHGRLLNGCGRSETTTRLRWRLLTSTI